MKPLNLIVIFFVGLLFVQCSTEQVDPDEDYSEYSFQVARLKITTADEQDITSRDEYLDCYITVTSDLDKWNYAGLGRIRGRGNSTWLWYPKKPYRIKLDEKSEILGLQANKDWVLLSNYRDPTHLMNAFVFTVGQELEMPFTNHSRFVEVTLNDEYIGLYQLTEQIEQAKSRVNIADDGGILLSLDADDGPYYAPDATDNFWSSIYNMPICIKYPDDPTSQIISTVKDEFKTLENTIKSGTYAEVQEVLDVPTFIDFLIIQEFVYNVELAAPRSMYIHKDVGGKWTMGPLWDFDAGFDFDWSTMYTGHNFFSNYRELVLGTDPANQIGGYRVPSFFTDLFYHRKFVAAFQARWLEIKDLIMTDYWLTTLQYANGFNEAMERENTRWPIDKNNQTEISRMEQYLQSRVDYLEGIIANYPSGTK